MESDMAAAVDSVWLAAVGSDPLETMCSDMVTEDSDMVSEDSDMVTEDSDMVAVGLGAVDLRSVYG